MSCFAHYLPAYYIFRFNLRIRTLRTSPRLSFRRQAKEFAGSNMRPHMQAVLAMVTSAFMLSFGLIVSQPTETGTACENGQRFDGTSSSCACNTDPNVGATFRGTTCQLPSQECGGAVWCVNGGTCKLQFNSNVYACQCPNGTRGAHCDQDSVTATCPDKSQCQNGGSCQKLNNVENSYICRCPAGFVGNDCQVNAAALNADVCGAQLYCLNSGRCNSAGNACICAGGYNGKLCDSIMKNSPGVADSNPNSDVSTGKKTVSRENTSGRNVANSGLSGGGIAGICIGVAAGVALLAIIAAMVWRRRRSTRIRDEETDGQKFVTNPQISSSHEASPPAEHVRRGHGDIIPS